MKKTFYISTLGIMFSLLVLLIPTDAVAQSKNYKAYGVFIFSFARYTEWPAEMKTEEEVKIAVLGNSALYDELASAFATRTVSGKKLIVQRVDAPEQLNGFHIVVLPANKNGQLSEVVKATDKQATLIITEHDGQTKKGAAISFVITDEKRLAFELNEAALNERQLKIASSLKSLAVSEY